MIKTTHVSIQCPECDHTEFEQPDNVQDNDFVKCNSCGFQIMLADLKEVGIEQAKEIVIPEAKKEIEKILKKAFKGRLK
ncbi:ECs_2282 family putative zinc-binding protein [Aeromonas hydrophila]|uniref:ECs_2282 family putative zinc-binding protein n=1 Tax=Aeromonas hydrophila TaxID=644 RepID=UPI003F79D3CE